MSDTECSSPVERTWFQAFPGCMIVPKCAEPDASSPPPTHGWVFTLLGAAALLGLCTASLHQNCCLLLPCTLWGHVYSSPAYSLACCT